MKSRGDKLELGDMNEYNFLQFDRRAMNIFKCVQKIVI